MSLVELEKVMPKIVCGQPEFPSYRKLGTANEIYYRTPSGLRYGDVLRPHESLPSGWQKSAVHVVLAAEVTSPHDVYELAIFRTSNTLGVAPGIHSAFESGSRPFALEDVQVDLASVELAEVYAAYCRSMAPGYHNMPRSYVDEMAQIAFQNVGLVPPPPQLEADSILQRA